MGEKGSRCAPFGRPKPWWRSFAASIASMLFLTGCSGLRQPNVTDRVPSLRVADAALVAGAPELALRVADQFHGVVVATTTPGSGPLSEIDLAGIKADSYSMTNDLLTLYAGDKVVDSLVLHAMPAQMFVGQGSSGVAIELNGQSTGVSGLPLHTTSP